jgi:hypothetical protein
VEGSCLSGIKGNILLVEKYNFKVIFSIENLKKEGEIK